MHKVLLWLKFTFLKEKKVFFVIFLKIFEIFSNSAAWSQNLRLVHNSSLFCKIFDKYVGLGLSSIYRNGKFKSQNSLCVFLNINVVYEQPLSLKWELTLLTPYTSFCTSLLQKRTEKRPKKENCKLHSNNAWQKLKVRKKWYFVTKIANSPTVRNKCFSDREKLLTFEQWKVRTIFGNRMLF